MTTETVKETKVISILAHRLPEALEALKKLAKKAQRYGCPDITVEVGEYEMVDHWYKDWDEGVERCTKLQHVNLIVSGDAPRVGNHEFLARIELTPNGNLVDVRPGVEDLDTRFRDSDGYCDHCKTKRRRNEVFAVRNLDTGEQLQIGRNCLRDFMGIDNPAHVAHRFAFWRMTEEWEQGFGGGRPEFLQSLIGTLSLTATCIRLFGWCSKSQAQFTEVLPTSHYVHLVLFPEPREKQKTIDLRKRIEAERTEADWETAINTIEWVRNKMSDRSEYEHNLKVLFGSDSIHEAKRMGICISAVASYQREVERQLRYTQERQTAAKSQHLGKIGERLRDLKVTLSSQKVIGGNDFGDLVLIKFTDDAGNVICWFTSRGSGMEVGEQCLLTGTVKKHNDYNGNAETALTRCVLKELAA